MKAVRSVILCFLFFGSHLSIVQSADFDMSIDGQTALWTSVSLNEPIFIQPAGRFVPALLGNWKINDKFYMNFEASLNANASFLINDFKYDNYKDTLKPYRIWMRFSGENYEIRTGLQKINFGSAKIFRPLMWFDEMDVRDPLQLTDGVYGVLGKYFLENNANVWLWSLYGNNKTKGFEFTSTLRNTPEFGGRIELPIGPGEFGLATHTRKISVVNTMGDGLSLREYRLGFNGKWDFGIGLWFEGSLYFTPHNELIPEHVNVYNVGADYTLSIGNGMGLSFEYFRYDYTETVFNSNGKMELLGLMLNYPLSINDQLSAILFAIPSQNQFVRYLSWSKTVDDFSFYTIAYWNPDTVFSIAQLNTDSRFSMGTGIQLMFSYNFSRKLMK